MKAKDYVLTLVGVNDGDLIAEVSVDALDHSNGNSKDYVSLLVEQHQLDTRSDFLLIHLMQGQRINIYLNAKQCNEMQYIPQVQDYITHLTKYAQHQGWRGLGTPNKVYVNRLYTDVSNYEAKITA